MQAYPGGVQDRSEDITTPVQLESLTKVSPPAVWFIALSSGPKPCNTVQVDSHVPIWQRFAPVQSSVKFACLHLFIEDRFFRALILRAQIGKG
jgi:hypothetical protein